MNKQRIVIGIVVVLFVAQAVVVIGWPYVREARGSRRKAEARARREAQVEPIKEVVLRYWIDRDFARERDRGEVFTLSFGAEDPSDAFLQRFAGGGYRVRKRPPDRPGGVREKPGPRIWVPRPRKGSPLSVLELGHISWRSDTEAEASGTATYASSRHLRPVLDLMLFHLRRERGTWKVVEAEELGGSATAPVYEPIIRYCIDHELAQARDRGETFLLRLEGGEIGDDVLRRLMREGYHVAKSTEARTDPRGPVITVNRIAPGVASDVSRRPLDSRPLLVEMAGRVQGAGRSGQTDYAMRFHLRPEGQGWKVVGAERR